MPSLKEIITFEYESAYDSAYDLPVKKNYSLPKLHTAGGDLSKRWYVYFSYRNPKTGKLKRVTPLYGEANKYKTKEDRLYILSAYRKKILELLKKGYNPFDENAELHQKETDPIVEKVVATVKPETVAEAEIINKPEKSKKPILKSKVKKQRPEISDEKIEKMILESVFKVKL
ncbi:hypothetical protein EC396_09075 [Lutibacter sp. HS1-25]|uniref:hypothetical protein n=1 Tax=Lutibacter sp. HS1-25 TaxID=2485000 RepID=UPI00101100E2|nr:hypothetical protein [Lutibacter sp. HS1-25]RXP54525.1 hypothetical protein EC396_09075 [Lutibacter sp. HS1-25]